MKATIQINEKISLIQKLRLLHAIAEVSECLSLPSEEAKKLSLLAEKFSLPIAVDKPGFVIDQHLEVNHQVPWTAIGSLKRSLIFPHVILQYCKSNWAAERDIQFAFAGLVTAQRKKVIKSWLRNHLQETEVNKSIWRFEFICLRSKISCFSGFSYSIKSVINDVVFWSSNKGRKFPIKAWDDEYFKLMCHSKFVLCPNGDHIWSYRFFEAILCGAIPIVQDDCSAYDGFFYCKMDDNPAAYDFSEKIINDNYAMAIKRLTIPIDEIQSEIEKIMS